MYPRPTSYSTALGPGCAGPSFMLPQGVAEARPEAGKPTMHRTNNGQAEMAVDPAVLDQPGNQDPTQRTMCVGILIQYLHDTSINHDYCV